MHFRPRCVVWVVVFIHLRMETPLPARVALQGRIHRYPRAQYVYFLVWKRRCADVRAGTQAPPLRILLERVARGCSPLRFRLGGLCAERLMPFWGLRIGG